VVTRNTDSIVNTPAPPPVTVVTPAKPVVKPDTIAAKKPAVPVIPVPVSNKKDTVVTAPPPVAVAGNYAYKANEKYYTVLVLNKVDPVFANEAKNAFFRYNREIFYNKTYTTELMPLDDDNRLLLMSFFIDAQDAVNYVEKVRPKTATDIIPWLKGGKYYFTIITESNLQILKTNKDLDAYKRFLEQHLPGKF
jgi:REP element-mobilizing transposase RayT